MSETVRLSNTPGDRRAPCGCTVKVASSGNLLVYCPLHAAAKEMREELRRTREINGDLLAALKETRNACAALMRAMVTLPEEQHAAIMDAVGTDYDGFGARANAAIKRAEGRP